MCTHLTSWDFVLRSNNSKSSIFKCLFLSIYLFDFPFYLVFNVLRLLLCCSILDCVKVCLKCVFKVCVLTVCSLQGVCEATLSLSATLVCVCRSIRPDVSWQRHLVVTVGTVCSQGKTHSLVNNLLNMMMMMFLILNPDDVRDTDQLQAELCDGSVSAPQLLSELLHLLQESLHLKHTHIHRNQI